MLSRVASRISLYTLLLAQSLPCTAAPVLPHFSTVAPSAGPVQYSGKTPTFSHNSRPNSSLKNWSANLNLSSTKANSNLSTGLLSNIKTVDIIVGATQLAVNGNTLLTPAEKAAVFQIVQTGHQSLILDAQGSASGGTFTIGSNLSTRLSNLVIPRGVTAIDYTNSGAMHLTGNLIDAGKLYLISSNQVVDNFSIVANSITVSSQGLISSTLPTSSNFTNSAPAGAGLYLSAQNNIVNLGTISSGGTLTINAGGSLTNGLQNTSGAAQAVLQAARDITLISASGQISNGGLITSSGGSINISTTGEATDLSINSSGGTFQALAGNINLRDASYSGSNNIYLLGGNYLSQNLNLYSGTGTINAITGQISGKLNSVASVEHFAADTKLLTLSNNTISGDPTFVNTGGDILISGINSFGENVAILASGNISADGSAAIVDSGNAVTLVAGAGLSVSGSGGVNILGGTTISAGRGPSVLRAGDVVTVNFSSSPSASTPGGTGGSIDLSASSASAIIDTTATSGSGGNGGNVTLAAFANGNTGGNIILNRSSGTTGAINTYGDGTGAGGNVNIYAGATPSAQSNSIQVGNITTGGAGLAGNGSTSGAVNIFTAQPQASGGPTSNTITFDSTGTIGSGQSIINSSVISPNAGILAGTITTAGAGGQGASTFNNVNSANGANGGNVSLSAGAIVSTGSVEAFGGGGGGASNFQGPAGAGGAGGIITLSSASGTITVTGDLNSSGGGGGGAGGGGSTTAGLGGNAGNIAVLTGGSIAISGVVLAASGGDGSPTNNGGGSFGGGGGAGTSGATAGTGGSGTFGGGGAAGGFNGGAGGGGGFSGSGGGGAGDVIGGAGGGGGGTGSTHGGITSSGNGGTGGLGGGAGGSSILGGGSGGNGGSGGTGFGQLGELGLAFLGGRGGSAGQNIASFGDGGDNAGGSVSATAGQIQLSGQTVAVTGAITNAGQFNGQSIVASGNSGSVTINGGGGIIGSTVFQTSANFGPAAPTASISISPNPNSFSLPNGSIAAGTQITVNGTNLGTSASAGSYASSSLLITEGRNLVIVGSGALVTPAETVALVQASQGVQTLVLSQPISTSAAGTGFASGGSFSLGSANLPESASFNNLILPAGVSANVTVPVINYNGPVIINGSLNSTGQIVFTTSALINNGSVSSTASSDAITVQNPTGNLSLGGSGSFTTAASSNINFLAMSAGSSITLTDGTALTINGGGAVNIRTPNLIFAATTSSPSLTATGASQIIIDSGSSAPSVAMTITGTAGFSGTIATNGGLLLVRPTGLLELEKSGVAATTINLNAGSGGVVDVQALGSVTIDNQVTFSSNSPLQINLNAGQTLALNGNATLRTTFGGNATFPDPLGGTFQYSILVQNLISGFNLAGTGTIMQGGTFAGFTVFNDFTNIGFADGTNLSFQSATPGSVVNFFTRQIQVNGTLLDSSPTANLSASSTVAAFNFNTNLPSFGPGDFAFLPGSMASSATLNISGAPMSVGYAGSTPPINIPAAQQPIGNLNLGMGGSFTLTNNQAVTVDAVGSVNVLTAGTLIASPNINLTAFKGNVGSSSAPLAVSSGSSGTLNLNLSVNAPGSSTGNGNVWLTDGDADPGAVGNPAVFLNGVAGSGQGVLQNGTFSLTMTASGSQAGSIGIHSGTLTASNQILLYATGSIFQQYGETISAPNISLTALAGNIGLGSSTPILVSSGASGSSALNLTVNAAANTSGNGNIYIADADSDINWGVSTPALNLKGATAGSGSPVDSTTGNLQVTTSSGGISISGALNASTSIIFNANNSILQQGLGASLASPIIQLTSTTGNIGSSTTPLSVSRGAIASTLNLSAVASANTNGNGNIWLTDSDSDVVAGNPAVLLYGIAGSGTAALQSGTFAMTETAGSIGIHPTVLSASNNIVLMAQQSIIQKQGEVVSSPSISLTATMGNIGISSPSIIPFIVSSGANGITALHLTVNAPANTSGNGNVYITDGDSDLVSGAPALVLGTSTAGSGTPVNATTGNLQVSSSAGGIAVNGAISASSSIILAANTNVVQAAAGSLSSPSLSLTATEGSIGTNAQPITSNASSLSANASANVYLSANNVALSLGASSGNTFVLTTTGANANTTINTISANNITLQAQAASNGSFVLNGNIGGKLLTDAASVSINAAGSGTISSGTNGNIDTNALSLYSASGTIGTIANQINTDAAIVTANTGASAVQTGIYLNDTNASNVTFNTSSSGNWFYISAANNVTVNGPITAGNTASGGSLEILNGGNITLNASLVCNDGDPSINGIFIQTSNFGVISQTSGTINTAGSIMVIDAGFGNIGSAAQPISISGNGAQLGLNFASTGNAYFTSPNGLRCFNCIGNDIQITAANNVTIAGLTTVNNLSIRTTDGGNVDFDAGSLALFAGGNASSVAVNVNGNATINTTNNFNLTANSVSLVSAAGDIGQSSNPIKTSAAAFSANTLGQVFVTDTYTGTLSVGASSATNFSLTAAGSIVTAAQLNVSGSLSLVANAGNISFTSSPVHNLTLQASEGILNLPTNQVSVIPDNSGNGGSIVLSAGTLAYPGSSTGTLLTLNAAGTGTGNGGSASITLTSVNPVAVNSAILTPNALRTQIGSINVASGPAGGNGGSIIVSSGGSLTVNPASILSAPSNGNGASITLQAGSTLLVSGALSANAAGRGSGGSIVLQSNSLTVFNAGATVNTNGVQGLLSVAGAGGLANGSISLSNLGGNVTNSAALASVNNLTMDAGAAGSVAVANTLGNTSSTSIKLTATGTGNITSTTTNINAITLTLSAGGNIAGNSTGTTPLTFNALNLSANAGASSIVIAGDTNHDLVTLAASSAGKTFSLSTNGSLIVSGAVGSTTATAVTLKTAANGSITVNAPITASSVAPVGTAPTPTITLNANGSGSITGAGVLTGRAVTLLSTTGGIGAGGALLQIDTATLAANTKGLVALNNTNASANTLAKSSALSFTMTDSGPLTLNSIAASGGAINVQNAAGVLQTAAAASLTATSGSITLQDNDSLASGSIILGKGSIIATTGKAPNNFFVTVSVGTGGTLSSTPPQNIKVVTGTTGGQAFFSQQGSITALTPVNTVNLKGSNVTLDAGLNGAIKLDGQVTITADPLPANSASEMARSGAIAFNTSALSSSNTSSSATVSDSSAATNISSSSVSTCSSGSTAAPTSLSPASSSPLSSPSTYSSMISLGSSNPNYALPSTAAFFGQISSSAFQATSANGNMIQVQSATISTAKTSADENSATSSLLMPTALSSNSSEFELADGRISSVISSDLELGLKHSKNSSGKVMTLDKGALLLAPTSDKTIKTNFGTVKIAAGSLVLILASSVGVAVYDLDDTHTQAVTVSTAQEEFVLSPGVSVMISSSAVKTFDQINPAQLLAYRNIVAKEIGGGLKVFSTEFSVPGAVQVVLPLKQLLKSGHPNARRISAHLFKTTAARLQIQSKGTSFQQVTRPTATACAI